VRATLTKARQVLQGRASAGLTKLQHTLFQARIDLNENRLAQVVHNLQNDVALLASSATAWAGFLLGVAAGPAGVKCGEEFHPNFPAQLLLLRRGNTRGLLDLGLSLTVEEVTNNHVGFPWRQRIEDFRRNGVMSFTILTRPIIRAHFIDTYDSLVISGWSSG
jgi:hypothetical protein